VVVAAGAALVIAAVVWLLPAQTPNRLTMTVLSVGAGSATVIELPDGRAVLYDAGGTGPRDVGQGVIVPFLRHRGIERIEGVYLSHANLDHYNGLLSVVDEMETGPVWLNTYFGNQSDERAPSRFLLNELAERGHPVEMLPLSGERREIGGATFELLWPVGEIDNTLITNDTSTVLRVCYAGRCILLTGDIDERAQYQLMQHGDLSADVLLLPHHGSVVSTTKAFVETTGAGIVIRSSHERMADTLTKLAEIVADRRVFNTADDGAIAVAIDARGVRVEPMWGGVRASVP
jgi:competence protein ComEC